jgi:hypothetical protein
VGVEGQDVCVFGDTTVVDKWRKDREKNMEINRPYAVVHYSKFLKGLHISSEVKLETFLNSPFCYTKVLALKNSIQLLLDYMQFLKSRAQEHKL